MIWGLLLAGLLPAAPFAEKFFFVQPDGIALELWGEGNEFHAVFETPDGYTVQFDPARRGYCYARLSPDQTELQSTGVLVGEAPPGPLGLPRHLRLPAAALKRAVAQRYAAWDRALDLSTRWSRLKATERARDAAPQVGTLPAPPGRPTVGVQVGLTLLIDFDDSPATIPRADIEDFLNGDNYTDFGNHGSVKAYFLDNSNGRLTYTNVVTAYVRIPNALHPKRYYDDPTKDQGTQANLLIRDALDRLKAQPNYLTEILPAFGPLTVDESDRVVALNVLYAGGNSGVWSKGLWPHSWALFTVGEQELAPGDQRLWRYQITHIGNRLSLGVFSHETGHLLCGFPDIYDYDSDSRGGAGRFCLMNSGGSGGNPVQICAYLKRAAGWATTTELDRASALTAVLSAAPGTNFNHFYRYAKPGAPTEYFLLENRQPTGRDAGIPAAGMAIWHIDELGNHNNQSLATNSLHANYEVTLVQADNAWHLQRDLNSGDEQDLWFQGNAAPGYLNRFSDQTLPAAHWWDGTPSGLALRQFSPSGPTMTVAVENSGGTAPPLIARQPQSQASAEGQEVLLSVIADGAAPFTYQWRKAESVLFGATNRTFTLSAPGTNDAGGYSVIVRNAYGAVTSDVATVTIYRDTIAPETPTGLALVPLSCDRIHLRWQPAADTGGANLAGYRILRDGVAVATTAFTSFADSELEAATRYCYAVVALDTAGNASVPSASVCAETSGCLRPSWIAYNDHYAGPATHPNTTAWNVFGTRNGAPGRDGALRNILTGAWLPVRLMITQHGASGGPAGGVPAPGTPAAQFFGGYVDFGSGALDHSIEISDDNSVTYTFSGLDWNKVYNFQGTAIRGNASYTDRWTLIELDGAESFTGAHSPGALDPLALPDLAPNQMLLNTGANAAAGDLCDWENVRPGLDGTVALLARQYTGNLPGGSSAGAAPRAYALTALRIEELTTTNVEPVAWTRHPEDQSVPEGQTALLSAAAIGDPRFFQWYKDGVPIANATGAAYEIRAAAVSDAGVYVAVVSNSLAKATSNPARLTIQPDQQAPVLLQAIGLMDQTQIQATFSEPLSPDSVRADLNASYRVAPLLGGEPLDIVAAELVAETNILLTTTPRTVGLNYQLTVANVADAAAQANVLAPNPSHAILAEELMLLSASANHLWKYDQTAPYRKGWWTASFNDADWATGFAVFSQNAGEDGLPAGFRNRTAIEAPSGGGPNTSYFRTHFALPGPPDQVELSLSYVVDDGAVFYLNGAEIHRVRLPAGPLDFSTRAATAPEPHPREGPFRVSLAALVEGDNVLAVELHQSSAHSSDAVLGVELTAVMPLLTEPPPPTIQVQRNAFGFLILSWSAPGYTLQQSASITGPWTDLPNRSSYTANPHVAAARFFRLKR